MLSNFVEYCRIFLNVEFCRILSNSVEFFECCRMLSNVCRMLSNVVEFSRILSNSPRILSNASNPLNFIDFYSFFLNFGKYCILVQYNPIPGISSSFQSKSITSQSLLFIFMVGQLNSKEVIAPSHFFTSDHRSCPCPVLPGPVRSSWSLVGR